MTESLKATLKNRNEKRMLDRMLDSGICGEITGLNNNCTAFSITINDDYYKLEKCPYSNKISIYNSSSYTTSNLNPKPNMNSFCYLCSKLQDCIRGDPNVI